MRQSNRLILACLTSGSSYVPRKITPLDFGWFFFKFFQIEGTIKNLLITAITLNLEPKITFAKPLKNEVTQKNEHGGRMRTKLAIRNLNQIGGGAEETLGRGEETMGRGEETLGRGEETMGRSEETLGRDEETLGRGEETLGRDEESLGRDEETLSKGEETMGRGEETLSKGKETLGRNEDLFLKMNNKSKSKIYIKDKRRQT